MIPIKQHGIEKHKKIRIVNFKFCIGVASLIGTMFCVYKIVGYLATIEGLR